MRVAYVPTEQLSCFVEQVLPLCALQAGKTITALDLQEKENAISLEILASQLNSPVTMPVYSSTGTNGGVL